MEGERDEEGGEGRRGREEKEEKKEEERKWLPKIILKARPNRTLAMF